LNILVLGSEGFIGRHIVRYFLHKGFNVFGCDLVELRSADYHYLDLSRKPEAINELFKNELFLACINASGNGDVGYSLKYPLNDFESNTYHVARLLDSIRIHSPDCIYMHISSAAVYGNPKMLPVSESATIEPLSPYGWHKWMSEIICREYAQLHKVKAVILRPFSVYGPGLKKQLFWDVHRKYLSGKDTMELWGTGQESRDFIYITDLVRAMDLVLEKGTHSGEVYNIGSGWETTVADAVGELLSCFDRNIELTFNQQVRVGDPLNWKADISLLEKLGFKSEMPFSEGIKQVGTWLNNLS